MLTTLFSSDEFRTGACPVVKRPLRFAISAMRALGARSSGSGLASHLEAMGQRPFGWAMPDGYPMQTDVWASSLTPRWKFAIDLAQGKIAETNVDFAGLERLLSRSDSAVFCQRLAQSLLGTTLPAETLASFVVLAEPDRSAALPQWLALDVDGSRISMVCVDRKITLNGDVRSHVRTIRDCPRAAGFPAAAWARRRRAGNGDAARGDGWTVRVSSVGGSGLRPPASGL